MVLITLATVALLALGTTAYAFCKRDESSKSR